MTAPGPVFDSKEDNDGVYVMLSPMKESEIVLSVCRP